MLNIQKTFVLLDLILWQINVNNYLGVATENGWFILTNLDTLESTIKAYKQRFNIEEMFGDFESGGYNLEFTNVSDQQLISLILLISLAYTSATISGQKIKRMSVQNMSILLLKLDRLFAIIAVFILDYMGLIGSISLKKQAS